MPGKALACPKAKTIGDILCGVYVEALKKTLAKNLGEVNVKTLAETLGDVDCEAMLDTLAHPLAQVETYPHRDTHGMCRQKY